MAEVEQAITRIRALPGLAPEWPNRPAVRHLVLGRFPYGIAYLVGDENIIILALAHSRRQPGYWMRPDPAKTVTLQVRSETCTTDAAPGIFAAPHYSR